MVNSCKKMFCSTIRLAMTKRAAAMKGDVAREALRYKMEGGFQDETNCVWPLEN